MRHPRISHSLRLRLALGLTLSVLIAPNGYAADSAELGCRRAIESGLSGWMKKSLGARLRCQSDIISGIEGVSTDCVSGTGSPRLEGRLAKAGARLRKKLLASCAEANWGLLSYPGPCEDAPDFDSESMASCIETRAGAVVRRLFDLWYPTDLAFSRGPAAECMKLVPKRATVMVLKEMDARLGCLINHESGDTFSGIDCRGQLVPYGVGTSDQRLDKSIFRAQLAWMTGMPRACSIADFANLGYGSTCSNPQNSGSGLIDFHACVLRGNRLEGSFLVDLAFPSDPVCGNGIPQEGEECDDGVANSNTKPDSCRLDCVLPFCGDATADPDNGEECDDGGHVELDGCNSICRREYCGDSIVNNLPNESCDDGNSNANDPCTASCSAAVCGDGVVCSDPTCTTGPGGGPELCDLGAGNSESATCQTDCSGFVRTCTLTVGVTNAVTLSAVTYELSYFGADGEFAGTGGSVKCTSLLTGGLVSFFDNENKRTVKESLIVDAGFTAPRDVARCTYATNDPNLAGVDFPITVIAASDPNFNPVNALMAVTSVNCTP